MQTLFIMKNPVQNYAWGSCTAIAELTGSPASSAPQAELWMGAHPKSPSRIEIGDSWIPLNDYISENSDAVLGKSARRFGGTLPYLFKVLASARPLSIQAHPNREQARLGFERETRLEIPFDAPERNYKDLNHKPECLCALTQFHALCGFRPEPEITALLTAFCPKSLKGLTSALSSKGIKEFFQQIITLSPDQKKRAIAEAVQLSRSTPARPEAVWILRLHQEYPEDSGVISPLFLNLITLEPGQSLFLSDGQLHSYLQGTAIELMANSDNVLRGGLTPKHMDVPELLNILDFHSSTLRVVEGQAISPSEQIYPAPAEEFSLSQIRLDPLWPKAVFNVDSPEILLFTAGRAVLSSPSNSRKLDVRKGMSVFVSAAAGQYQLSGETCCFRARVPILGVE
jgi:mannose-6-phosphate isomerase